MTDIIAENQSLPSAVTPLTDRYGMVQPTWYPWFVKIIGFVNGIASGEMVIDGWLRARMFSAGLIEGDFIAANAIDTVHLQAGAVVAETIDSGAITVDKLDVANVSVLNGTFGTLKTNETTTRVEITDVANALRVYIGGLLALEAGGTIADTVINLVSNTASIYGGKFRNTSTTGGGSSNGGGAIYAQSNGGFTIEARGAATSAGALGTAAIVGANTGSGGGTGRLGLSSGSGGWGVYATTGGVGPFTGGHDGLIAKGDTFEPGDIVVDGSVIARDISDCLTVVHRSTAPEQPGVGVYVRRHTLEGRPASLRDMDAGAFAALGNVYDNAVWNGLGEGAINVCGEGGDIAPGDLIVTSSMPGKGMKQSDNLVRSISVAKAREAVSFTGPTDVRQIACFYISG